MLEKQKEVKNSVSLKTDYNEVNVGPHVMEDLLRGVNILAKAVLATMGPNGSTVIVPDINGKYYATKDGVSVARSIAVADPIQNIGINLLKEVAENTVKKAGDGTTTAICLAQSLLVACIAEITAGTPIKEVVEDLNIINKLVKVNLEDYTTPFSHKDVFDIAKTSANGDNSIGNLLSKAFKYSDNVQVQLGNSTEHTIEEIDGMELNSGLFSPSFINKHESQSIEYDESILVIIDGNLDSLKELQSAVKNIDPSKPILVLADNFSSSVVKTLLTSYNNGSVTIGLLKSPGFASHRQALRNDIITAIEAKQSDASNDIYIGTINSIKATSSNMVISYNRSEAVDKLADTIKDAISSTKNSTTKKLLQNRLDIVQGKLVNINVGGASELEVRETYDRVEDAVLAVKSAITGGTIQGGGIPLYTIGSMKGIKILHALMAPTIFMGLTAADIPKWVKDPVNVTITAVSNAISVVKVILSTDGVVLNRNEWR